MARPEYSDDMVTSRMEAILESAMELLEAEGIDGISLRKTAKLMGWDVQVSKDESQHAQFEQRVGDAATTLGEQLGIDAEMADKLFRAGGATAELVAQMPADYIAQALEILESDAETILSKALPSTEETSGETADA